ncbi:MAG: SpoIIE family protein phosphatase [Eubacterium sp.]|nr:SpoIIE family protein phosphatase [Eubacterium sp.]
MKKIKNWVLGGLQQKIFNLVLITIILIVAAYTIVINYQAKHLQALVTETSLKQEASIDEISTMTMDAVVNSSLNKTTELEAYIANEVFEDLQKNVMILGDYAEKLFADPESWPEREVNLPDQALDGEVSVQVLSEEGIDLEDPETAEHIALIGNMADMMKALLRNAQVDTSFAATPDGIIVMADDCSGVKFDENGKIKPIAVRQRPWYTGAVEKQGLYYTEVEKDTFTDRIGIVCSLPIYVDGELVCVVGADLFLNTMAEAVEASEDAYGGFVCIMNQAGHVIFSPEKEGVFQVQNSEEAQDLRNSEYPELAQFTDQALKGKTEVQLVHVGDTAYFMSACPMDTVGWSLVSVIDEATVREPTVMMQNQYQAINEEAMGGFEDNIRRALQTLIVLLLVIVALAIAAALTVAKRIVKPLNTITERVAQLGGNNLRFRMEDVYRTGDEIEVLAEAFSDLSGKTLEYVEEIKNVTAEKERIGAELGMAKAIQASQLPHLFPAFPDRKEFDIYATMTPAKEVGGDFYDFFLLDDDHIGLVMADVAGKGVPAALFMMVSRLLIRNRIQSGESPSMALANVNDQLMEGNEAEMFVTVWLAVLEISTGRGVVTNAGHEHPVLRRADGKYDFIKYRHSAAVAVFPEMAYEEHTFELNPGDSLFVYTDGVVEAANAEDELFGTKRLLQALNKEPGATPDQILHNVREDIAAFVDEAEQFDDVTMMCLQYSGPVK